MVCWLRLWLLLWIDEPCFSQAGIYVTDLQFTTKHFYNRVTLKIALKNALIEINSGRRGFNSHLVKTQCFWCTARLPRSVIATTPPLAMTSAPMTRVGHSACLVWTIAEAAGGSKTQCPHCAITKCTAGKFSYLIAPWPWISNSQPKVNATLQPPPWCTAEQFHYANNGTLVQSQEQASTSSCWLSSSAFTMYRRTGVILSRLHELPTI